MEQKDCINLSKFAENLKWLMDEKQIKPTELANELDFAPSSVYKYLQGIREPSTGTLIKLCDFFCCSADFLIGITEYSFQNGFKPCPPFPEQLKTLVESKSESYYEFAKNANIPEGCLFAWKNARRMPDINGLLKICRYLKSSLDFVLGREL